MSKKVFKDAIGQVISVGDIVVHATFTRYGGLALKKVMSLSPKKIRVAHCGRNGMVGHPDITTPIDDHNTVVVTKNLEALLAPFKPGDKVRVTAPEEGFNAGVFPVTGLQGNLVELGGTKFSRPVAEVVKVDG